MNRNEAKKLAQVISVEELNQMFINAQNSIKDWDDVSIVNKGMTKGTAFNILTKCGVTANTHILAKINMIREFGKYVPDHLKPVKKTKFQYPNPVHQEPNFI